MVTSGLSLGCLEWFATVLDARMRAIYALPPSSPPATPNSTFHSSQILTTRLSIPDSHYEIPVDGRGGASAGPRRIWEICRLTVADNVMSAVLAGLFGMVGNGFRHVFARFAQLPLPSPPVSLSPALSHQRASTQSSAAVRLPLQDGALRWPLGRLI